MTRDGPSFGAQVVALEGLRDPVVLYALSRSRKLASILDHARRDGWWFAGKACQEDDIEFSARCRPTAWPTTVFATKGWSNAFHGSPACEALQSGQRAVLARDGESATLEPSHVQAALGAGRSPCRVCVSRAGLRSQLRCIGRSRLALSSRTRHQAMICVPDRLRTNRQSARGSIDD